MYSNRILSDYAAIERHVGTVRVKSGHESDNRVADKQYSPLFISILIQLNRWNNQMTLQMEQLNDPTDGTTKWPYRWNN